jgi:DNA-binding transcriptional LysR family regulator
MTTAQLRAFVAIATERKLTLAARQLRTSQSGLTRQLQSLERELGTRLLVRTSRGVVLTTAGERFRLHAQRALDTLQEAQASLDDLAQRPQGAVALGAIMTVATTVLPELLRRFHERHPEVLLRLTQANTNRLEELVAQGTLDLALLELPVQHLDLQVQKLWQEEFVLAVNVRHPLAARARPVHLRELVDEPFAIIPNVPSTRALEEACEAHDRKLRVVVETDNSGSLRRTVEQGLALALLPVVAAGNGDALCKVRPIAGGGVRRQLALVHRGDDYLTAASRALKQLAVQALRT